MASEGFPHGAEAIWTMTDAKADGAYPQHHAPQPHPARRARARRARAHARTRARAQRAAFGGSAASVPAAAASASPRPSAPSSTYFGHLVRVVPRGPPRNGTWHCRAAATGDENLLAQRDRVPVCPPEQLRMASTGPAWSWPSCWVGAPPRGAKAWRPARPKRTAARQGACPRSADGRGGGGGGGPRPASRCCLPRVPCLLAILPAASSAPDACTHGGQTDAQAGARAVHTLARIRGMRVCAHTYICTWHALTLPPSVSVSPSRMRAHTHTAILGRQGRW